MSAAVKVVPYRTRSISGAARMSKIAYVTSLLKVLSLTACCLMSSPPGRRQRLTLLRCAAFVGSVFTAAPITTAFATARPMYIRRRYTRLPIRMRGSHVQTATFSFFHTAAALRPHAPTATTLAPTDNAFRTGLPCRHVATRRCGTACRARRATISAAECANSPPEHITCWRSV